MNRPACPKLSGSVFGSAALHRMNARLMGEFPLQAKTASHIGKLVTESNESAPTHA